LTASPAARAASNTRAVCAGEKAMQQQPTEAQEFPIQEDMGDPGANDDSFQLLFKDELHERAVVRTLVEFGLKEWIDGRKVAATIGAASPLTPILLLTGWGQRLAAEDDVPPHVSRILNKPPRLHQLRSALAELTSEAKLTDSGHSMPHVKTM